MDEGQGFETIAEYIEAGAPFHWNVNDSKLASKTTVKTYWVWHKRFLQACPDAKLQIHHRFYDDKKKEAVFMGTMKATNTGPGGPVPEPTGKTSVTEVVLVVTFNSDQEIVCMTKIWNDACAYRDLGWPVEGATTSEE